MSKEEISNKYQDLFDYMYDNFDIILLISEMDEIASICQKTLK